MSLRRRISCSFLSVAVCLPSILPPASLGQTQPAPTEQSGVAPSNEHSQVSVSPELEGDLLTVRGRSTTVSAKSSRDLACPS